MTQTGILGDIAIRGGAASHASRSNAGLASAAESPPVGNAWLSIVDVALLVLRAEFAAMGLAAPERFAPKALASAVLSVKRWQSEGRIFAIRGLYARYQFDRNGQPIAPVERAIAVFGQANVAVIGNWFSVPNSYLQGRRPLDLLASAPDVVLRALQLH